MYTIASPAKTEAKFYAVSPFDIAGGQRTSLACRMVTGLPIQPASDPYVALAQLLKQVRGVLISLLSYELQTPLSIIQTTVETLSEGDTIPAQAQRSMIQQALSELNGLCHLVETFLDYANHVWAIAMDCALLRDDVSAPVCLKSMFSPLPDSFEHAQSGMDIASQHLLPFLEAMTQRQWPITDAAATQQRLMLEQEWQQVLAIVNHELRTPFTTLKVCLETLESEGDVPVEARQSLLSVANDDLKRLQSLTYDLALLSRLAARQVCFQTELVDLQATIQATLSSFLTQAPEEAAAKIQVEAPAQAPLVWADGDRLVEVIQRLLENACQFTAANGEIKIQLQMAGPEERRSVANRAISGMSMLNINVSDTGQGISAQQLACIFDCFHQEAGYLKRSQGGMGIGLTICRYLIEGMGGQIWAESLGKEQGSRFCFKLLVQQTATRLSAEYLSAD